MRRLSACLMIATLLVALVPTATLAGPPEKPVDAITSITWVSDGLNADGYCEWHVDVEYTVAKGPPRSLATTLAFGPDDEMYVWDTTFGAKVERDGAMTVGIWALAWKPSAWPCTEVACRRPVRALVSMTDNKANTVVPAMFTSPYDAYELGCPDEGTPMGTYTAP